MTGANEEVGWPMGDDVKRGSVEVYFSEELYGSSLLQRSYARQQRATWLRSTWLESLLAFFKPLPPAGGWVVKLPEHKGARVEHGPFETRDEALHEAVGIMEVWVNAHDRSSRIELRVQWRRYEDGAGRRYLSEGTGTSPPISSVE